MTRREANVLKGGTLYYNASQQMRYVRALRKLVRQMTRTVIKDAREFLKNNPNQYRSSLDAKETSVFQLKNSLMAKFDALFARKSDKLAETMLEESTKASNNAMQRSVKQISPDFKLSTSVLEALPESTGQAIIKENVALISSLPKEYFSQITDVVIDSITEGRGLQDLIPELMKYEGVTHRRAKNLALDQTRKAYNAANKATMEAAGITKFEWLHSGGGAHPRPSHVAMSGNIYSFDDLPVVNQEQVDRGYEGPQRGIPGDAINCKCTMTAVIEFE